MRLGPPADIQTAVEVSRPAATRSSAGIATRQVSNKIRSHLP
jgi:hypothetical protein